MSDTTFTNIGLMCILLSLIILAIWICYSYFFKPKNKSSNKWNTSFKCDNCDEILSPLEVYHSFGTCPHCGTTNNGTIVKVKKVIWRQLPSGEIIEK